MNQSVRDREQGMSLLIVLWVVTILALMLSGFSYVVRTNLTLTQTAVLGVKTEALADAAIELAVAHLASAPKERGWRVDGTPNLTALGDSTLSIRIADVNGLVDLNRADPELLLLFFNRFAGSSREAAAIRDFVMARREAVASPASGAQPQPSPAAPAAPSQAAPAPALAPAPVAGQLARGMAFAVVEDLRLAPHVGSAMLNAMAPFLTVHGNNGGINPATAPPEVLQIIPGLDARTVDGMLQARANPRDGAQDTNALPEAARKWLKPSQGPVYRIDVTVAAAGAAPIAVRANVIVPTKGDVPYYLLDLGPIDIRGTQP